MEGFNLIIGWHKALQKIKNMLFFYYQIFDGFSFQLFL